MEDPMEEPYESPVIGETPELCDDVTALAESQEHQFYFASSAGDPGQDLRQKRSNDQSDHLISLPAEKRVCTNEHGPDGPFLVNNGYIGVNFHEFSQGTSEVGDSAPAGTSFASIDFPADEECFDSEPGILPAVGGEEENRGKEIEVGVPINSDAGTSVVVNGTATDEGNDSVLMPPPVARSRLISQNILEEQSQSMLPPQPRFFGQNAKSAEESVAKNASPAVNTDVETSELLDSAAEVSLSDFNQAPAQHELMPSESSKSDDMTEESTNHASTPLIARSWVISQNTLDEQSQSMPPPEPRLSGQNAKSAEESVDAVEAKQVSPAANTAVETSELFDSAAEVSLSDFNQASVQHELVPCELSKSDELTNERTTPTCPEDDVIENGSMATDELKDSIMIPPPPFARSQFISENTMEELSQNQRLNIEFPEISSETEAPSTVLDESLIKESHQSMAPPPPRLSGQSANAERNSVDLVGAEVNPESSATSNSDDKSNPAPLNPSGDEFIINESGSCGAPSDVLIESRPFEPHENGVNVDEVKVDEPMDTMPPPPPRISGQQAKSACCSVEAEGKLESSVKLNADDESRTALATSSACEVTANTGPNHLLARSDEAFESAAVASAPIGNDICETEQEKDNSWPGMASEVNTSILVTMTDTSDATHNDSRSARVLGGLEVDVKSIECPLTDDIGAGGLARIDEAELAARDSIAGPTDNVGLSLAAEEEEEDGAFDYETTYTDATLDAGETNQRSAPSPPYASHTTIVSKPPLSPTTMQSTLDYLQSNMKIDDEHQNKEFYGREDQLSESYPQQAEMFSGVWPPQGQVARKFMPFKSPSTQSSAGSANSSPVRGTFWQAPFKDNQASYPSLRSEGDFRQDRAETASEVASVAEFRDDETSSVFAGSSCRGGYGLGSDSRLPSDPYRTPLTRGRDTREFDDGAFTEANLEKHDRMYTSSRYEPSGRAFRTQLETELAKERIKVADAIMVRAEAVIAAERRVMLADFQKQREQISRELSSAYQMQWSEVQSSLHKEKTSELTTCMSTHREDWKRRNRTASQVGDEHPENVEVQALLLSLKSHWAEECEMVIKERETAITAKFTAELADYRQQIRAEVEIDAESKIEHAVTLARLDWDRERLELKREYEDGLLYASRQANGPR